MTSHFPRHSSLPPAARGGCIKKGRTRVLIVDDHEAVRRGLAALVNAEEDMVSCGEVVCSEAVEETLRRRPDMVIIDVSAARGIGLQVIQRIRKSEPSIRIVALAMSDKPELAESIFNAGAAALVMKTDLAARVLEAIRRNVGKVRMGQNDGDRARMPRPVVPRAVDRCFDAMERDIVEMIGRGVPTRAIAVRVGMSVAMVEACRRRIRSKLNFPTASQLVQFCVRWAERARRPAIQRTD